MLNKLILIIILIGTNSCSKNKDLCPFISVENRNKWISDSTGCLEIRFKLINCIEYKKFIGRDLSCITRQLGNWDVFYKYGKVEYYCYFLNCKYAPIIKNNNVNLNKNILDKEATILRFGLKDNRVFSANILVP